MNADESLNTLARRIIGLLVFEEPFENIISEIREEGSHAIADELKLLIMKDYVKPCREIGAQKNSGLLFDSDKMNEYTFTLTGKGISYLERNLM